MPTQRYNNNTSCIQINRVYNFINIYITSSYFIHLYTYLLRTNTYLLETTIIILGQILTCQRKPTHTPANGPTCLALVLTNISSRHTELFSKMYSPFIHTYSLFQHIHVLTFLKHDRNSLTWSALSFLVPPLFLSDSLRFHLGCLL